MTPKEVQNSNSGPVLAFGELLWDLLPSGPVLGGAPANFAHRLNTLDIEALLVTRLGQDAWGDKARQAVEELGLDLTHVQLDPKKPTGTVKVELTAEGNPRFEIIKDVAYDYIELTPELMAAAAKASILCFGTLSQRAPVSSETLHQLIEAAPQAIKLLDINLRKDCYTAESIDYSLKQANILKLNQDEVTKLKELFNLKSDQTVDLVKTIIDRYEIDLCLVTLGDKGALFIERGGEIGYVPGHSVKVEDTVGSGDAFTAGFCSAFLKGESNAQACRLGNALGALAAQQKGATGPTDPALLERLLSESSMPRVADSEFKSYVL